MQRLALFDMDRTLVNCHTAWEHVKYKYRRKEAGWNDVLQMFVWMVEYQLGVIDAHQALSSLLQEIKGSKESTMLAQSTIWFDECIKQSISEAGRRAVDRHKAAGDTCVIITSAPIYAAIPLASVLGINFVVGTVFNKDESGYFTGTLEEPICMKKGKTARAEAFAEEHNYDLRAATFYTDSICDFDLLESVGEPVAVNPDIRLALRAKIKGWKIESWRN